MSDVLRVRVTLADGGLVPAEFAALLVAAIEHQAARLAARDAATATARDLARAILVAAARDWDDGRCVFCRSDDGHAADCVVPRARALSGVDAEGS